MRFVVRSLAPGASAVQEMSFEASTAADAQAQAIATGHAVLSVQAAGGAVAGARFNVAWWCRELRTLLRSGMTVVEAIDTLAAGKHDAQRHQVHMALLAALQQGQSLSRAMRTVGVFPAVLVAGVMASERTSTLADALDDYLRYEELLERLRRQAVSAAIYPSVVVGLGAVISLFLLLFVIPRFSRMYVDRQSELSTATEFVLAVSRMLQQHLPWVVVFLLLAVAAIGWAARSGLLQRAFTRLIEANTELRHQADQFRLAKLYQSLALMIRGGYTVDEALVVGEGLNLGTRMQASVASAHADISRGRPASSAFAQAGLTDVVTERLLAVGERTGAFDGVLQTIADRHAERFSTFVERATRIVEPLLLLVVALVVGGIVVMMYMPVFDMANSLGGGR
jgi:general secretion pathway protein F